MILVWDWNWFKGYVEDRIETATGRDFAIGGDLDVDLGWPIIVSAGELRLGNAEWSDNPEMARVQALTIAIRPWSLLRDRYDLEYVRLEHPWLLLERNAEADANWQFADPEDEPAAGEPPLIRELFIASGELHVRDLPRQTDLRLQLDSEDIEDQARSPLSAKGEGRYRGFAFELSGRVDSPLELRNTARPYRVDIRARAGATRARVRGEWLTPLQFGDFAVRFELSGSDLADLYPLFDIVLPMTPPYTLDGQLSRHADTWSYQDFQGTVGDSDLAGNTSIELAGERPMLIAHLHSQRLDFDDLAGFLGAAPATRNNETASQKQIAVAERQRTTGRVLPQNPYDPSKLRTMDADVELKADAVHAPSLPIQTFEGHLQLDNGVLRVDPLVAGVADGRVTGWITLDATRDPIGASLKLDLRRISLPHLFPDNELIDNSTGLIAGYANLEGRGNSVGAMLAHADGELGLIMGPGRISNLLVEFAGLDIAEALRFLLTEDQIIPVRCAYADFGFADGTATANAFVFDTTDTVIFGEGDIDFDDESLDLTLRPKPKDRSLLALRVPLRIEGTLGDPDFGPQAGSLLLRSIAAGALYSIAPPAALLAMIEWGPGEDSGCGPEAVDAETAPRAGDNEDDQ